MPAPTPIWFDPGAVSAIEYGRLAPGNVQRYQLRAMAGQQLVVYAWPERTFGITVQGVQSGYWAAPHQAGTLSILSLPATQDYIITLSLPAAQAPIDYLMEVAIRWP